MPRSFRVITKAIPDIRHGDDYLLGVVKIQMPHQLDEGGSCKIRQTERETNFRIVQNAIAAFGTWAEQVQSPTIILFPEFSVSEQAIDWLRNEISTAQIAPNTLVVLGLERLNKDEFLARVVNSDSRGNFTAADFGPNIDQVNTAVILVKDNASNVTCYYQPKCSRSDYESLRQLTSDVIYEFAFGQHNLIVSICSDFLLRDENETLVASVLQDLERLYQQPADHRLDLILLIQKNPSPLHRLYGESIKHLFYNRPHQIQTSDTIICAVNSVDFRAPEKYGNSNVSVMRRGRPPREFENRNSVEHFAWCSLRTQDAHLNEDLHFVRWRLRGAGGISFVLDTDRRPWPPANLDSMPVRRPGLQRIVDADRFEPVHPIPEVYELQGALYGDFQSFVEETFQADALKLYFSQIAEYERLLETLFIDRPHAVLRSLLLFHAVPLNCDRWDLNSLRDVFRYFLLTLRILNERYDDLKVVDAQLHADVHTLGIIDCKDRSFVEILKKLNSKVELVLDLDLLFLQRISELFPWDGRPTELDALNGLISVSKQKGVIAPGSVARAPSPKMADIGSIVRNLNQQCGTVADARRLLNESF